ncbi:MAG TPA: hypothetical protein VFI09_02730 [Solirubrobacterales bacterium]|nr:hypothetical protein [Solirubrobacterales bacterium]
MRGPPLKAWTLPLIVAAIAISIVFGFYLGGPGLGMAVGALAASSIVVMAVRHPPQAAIVPPSAEDSRSRLLIVLDSTMDDAAAGDVAWIAGDADIDGAAEILLISPCRSRFFDRWACDLDAGRHRAQRALVLSAAMLAKAGVQARAQTGDEDLVQMTEDVLRTFPATEVILVYGAASDAERSERDADALEARLRVPFRRVPVDAPSSIEVRDNQAHADVELRLRT